MCKDILYQNYEDWKDWDVFFNFSTEQAEYFAGEIRGIDLRDKTLLEMGFGSGSFLAWAVKRGARLFGTEINKKALEAARSNGIKLLDPDIEKIADDYSEKFDIIVAFDLFEHFPIEDIIIRIRAAEQMLKPGGHIILRFPNGQSPLGRIPQYGDITHVTCLSGDKFEQICEGSSLKTIRYQGSYRIKGRNPLKNMIRRTRYLLRDMIAGIVNAAFAINPPWDPSVVLVMRKDQ